MTKLNENLVLARTRASDLESVRKLNVWASELSDVNILRKMPNLQVASLSVNHINSLEDFAECGNLEELYIRKNKISNLAEICHLKNLPKLRILWLADNPCAVGDNYRATVLKALPNLQKLDNIAVQEEEVNDAIEQGVDLIHPKTSRSKSPPQKDESRLQTNNPATLTLEETNKIRAQLGMKTITPDKILTTKSSPSGKTKARNANVLQAVLCLIKELDVDSLEVVGNAVKNKLESM